MPDANANYPTPVIADVPAPGGLTFPGDGSGLAFDAGYPLTFTPDPVGDLASLFPTILPQVERIVYETIQDACSTRTVFPEEGQGLPLPAEFSILPDVGLFRGMDSTYPLPVGRNAGDPVPQIPVIRGWPAFPGALPAIGVAEAQTAEDQSERALQAGFAGDAYATDDLGNVLATCAYYSEPLVTTVVFELIHSNRDQRDRLQDQLLRVVYPLRRRLSRLSAQTFDVHIAAEKQDLPVDEQPNVIYVSVFTLEIHFEALIPSEITTDAVITELAITVTPTEVPTSADRSQDAIDLT